LALLSICYKISEDPAKVSRHRLMHKARPSGYLALVVLLALSLVGMTLGTACHQHTGSCDSNCSICHLSHQPIDRPMAARHAPTRVLLARTSEARGIQSAASPFFRRVPARAPPTA
jgi:hypothetical protein